MPVFVCVCVCFDALLFGEICLDFEMEMSANMMADQEGRCRILTLNNVDQSEFKCVPSNESLAQTPPACANA